MSRKNDLPILQGVFTPPPEITPWEARKLLQKHLSARQMRSMRQFVERLETSAREAVVRIGPEHLAKARVRRELGRTISQQ